MSSTPQEEWDSWFQETHPKSTPTWEIDIDDGTKGDEVEWDETHT